MGGRVDDEGDETNIRRSNNTNNSHTRSTGPRDKNLHSFNTYQFSAVKDRYTTKTGGEARLTTPLTALLPSAPIEAYSRGIALRVARPVRRLARLITPRPSSPPLSRFQDIAFPRGHPFTSLHRGKHRVYATEELHESGHRAERAGERHQSFFFGSTWEQGGEEEEMMMNFCRRRQSCLI